MLLNQAFKRAAREQAVVPGAVILEAVFDTMLNTVRNRFSALGVSSFASAEILLLLGGWQSDFCGFSHNLADYATSVTRPVFSMHGEGDSRATIAEAPRVYRSAKVPFSSFNHAQRHRYAQKSGTKNIVAIWISCGPSLFGSIKAFSMSLNWLSGENVEFAIHNPCIYMHSS